MPPDPLVGTNAYVCVTLLSRATIILLPPCSPPPPPPTQNPVWTPAMNLKCGICVESALLFIGKMYLLTGHHLTGIQCSFGYFLFLCSHAFLGTCLLAYTMVFNVNLVLCVSVDELHIKERIYWLQQHGTVASLFHGTEPVLTVLLVWLVCEYSTYVPKVLEQTSNVWIVRVHASVTSGRV